MATLQSACPLDCPDLCSLEVEVVDGRVKRVDGGTRTPITDGFICAKVRNIADHLYGEDRVRHPMIRVGAKDGTALGRFRRATWDEALDVIAERLREVRDRAGGEAILPFHYGGSNGWLTEGALATRFFRRLGASRCLRTLCALPSGMAARSLYGAVPGTALEDYADSKLIVLWGMNPSATGIHLVPIIERAIEGGAKLVVVDPRRTPLARRAHLHLAVRPGTDLPVALSVIRELFASGRADEGFLAEHTRGADELRRRAEPWTIGKAAAEAGLSDLDLGRFVDLYAETSPAVIRAGWGMERNRNGGSAVAAVLALPAVAGKFGVRGGGYTMSNGEAGWGVTAEAGIATPEPATRAVNMVELGSALTDGAPRVEVLFVYNCNPTQTVPDQNRVVRGLARDDLFTVVHEQVFTDTCRWAEVVLPATAFLEHREIRRGYGSMRLYDSAAVATPPGEARSNNQVFGALLEKLGLWRDGDAMTDDELAAAIFSGDAGGRLRAQLDQHGVATPPIERPRLFVDLAPATPDRKIDLVPAALDAEARGGLYHYEADPGTERHPLALISPAISQQISSTFGQLRKGEAAAELAPADARARGISDGDAIRIWNELGEVVCRAKLSAHVRDGVVVLTKGLWRFHTRNGQSSNALIPPTTTDFAGGACYNDARVQVERHA